MKNPLQKTFRSPKYYRVLSDYKHNLHVADEPKKAQQPTIRPPPPTYIGSAINW